jgi:hypothetical protein
MAGARDKVARLAHALQQARIDLENDPTRVKGIYDTRIPNMRESNDIIFGRLRAGLKQISEDALRRFNTSNEEAYQIVFDRHRVLSERLTTLPRIDAMLTVEYNRREVSATITMNAAGL